MKKELTDVEGEEVQEIKISAVDSPRGRKHHGSGLETYLNTSDSTAYLYTMTSVYDTLKQKSKAMVMNEIDKSITGIADTGVYEHEKDEGDGKGDGKGEVDGGNGKCITGINGINGLDTVNKILNQKKKEEQEAALAVTQGVIDEFREPMWCFRELVQNARDARTSRIDINFKLDYLLEGEALEQYLELIRIGNFPRLNQLEQMKNKQLVIDEQGYSDEVAELVGKNYLETLKNNAFSLGKSRKEDIIQKRYNSYADIYNYRVLRKREGNQLLRSYHLMLKNLLGYDLFKDNKIKHSIEKKFESLDQLLENIVVDDIGFSRQIAELLGNDKEKLVYFDLLMFSKLRVDYSDEGSNDSPNRMVKKILGRIMNNRKNDDNAAGTIIKKKKTKEEYIRELSERRVNFISSLLKVYPEEKEFEELVGESARYIKEVLKDRVRIRQYSPVRVFYDHLETEMGKNRNSVLVNSALESIKDKSLVELVISCEDYGTGMNHEERKRFLTNLFASSKKYDLETVGRFGIGFASAFALDPENVVVESTKKNESWRLVFDSKDNNFNSKCYQMKNDKYREKGTEVRIYMEPRNREPAKRFVEEAKEVISHFCEMIETPIFVDKIQVNKEFDVDCAVKMRFEGKGVEGVIGVSNEPFYKLFNHRILLGEGREFISGWNFQILASSKYLSYDITREHIEEDAHYHRIKRMIIMQKDNLAKNVFKKLEQLVRNRNERKESYIWKEEEAQYDWRTSSWKRVEVKYCIASEGTNHEEAELWNFAVKYIDEKIHQRNKENDELRWFGSWWRIDKKLKSLTANKRRLEDVLAPEILDTELFYDLGNNPVSFREFLDITIKHDKWDENEILYANSKDRLAELLLKSGKKIFKKSSVSFDQHDYWGSPRTSFVNKFGHTEDITSSYYVPVAFDEAELDEKQKSFLHYVNEEFKKSPLSKYYLKIKLANLGDKKDLTDEPFIELQNVKANAKWNQNSAMDMYDKYRYSSFYKKKKEATIKKNEESKKGLFGSMKKIRSVFSIKDTLLLNTHSEYIQDIIKLGYRRKKDAALLLFLAVASGKDYYNESVGKKMLDYLLSQKSNEKGGLYHGQE